MNKRKPENLHKSKTLKQPKGKPTTIVDLLDENYQKQINTNKKKKSFFFQNLTHE